MSKKNNLFEKKKKKNLKKQCPLEFLRRYIFYHKKDMLFVSYPKNKWLTENFRFQIEGCFLLYELGYALYNDHSLPHSKLKIVPKRIEFSFFFCPFFTSKTCLTALKYGAKILTTTGNHFFVSQNKTYQEVVIIFTQPWMILVDLYMIILMYISLVVMGGYNLYN